ncbi:hypothetical protein E5675_19000 [Sphingopyxis sp. PAMC25046]|uniref:hypothetical protein n=1 Tax=Sphingopyxis sp. PAMC25046 TaxID=2565556 RepID=UPI00109D8DE2|nr:hypothetical protein [Sphingopyxis sp. PAMC25046]QCB56311.1 hypothetical protein E5675_19000 [Sphingopyxis sp. PAMC25046]
MSDDNTGNPADTPYTGPDHGFGDDNALAAEILSFDHLNDTNGSAAASRQVLSRTEFKPTVSALAPEMRQPIIAQLAGLTGAAREAREAELVNTAIANLALGARVRQGPGVGANAYQVEMFAQANQLRQLDQEQSRIVAQLAEFDGYKTGAVDPTTGEPTAEKVYRYQGDRRRALENRLGEIAREAADLEGPAGDRRMKAALKKAVDDVKKSRDQYAIMEEAKARAVHNAREARIDKLAAGFGKGLTGNVA